MDKNARIAIAVDVKIKIHLEHDGRKRSWPSLLEIQTLSKRRTLSQIPSREI
jgi:hypothetical protein